MKNHYLFKRGEKKPVRPKRFHLCLLIAYFVLLGWSHPVEAGNNGWFTTYNSEIEKGEIELMLMNDFTAPSRHRREEDGFGDYFSHMVELEYAPFHRFATELMVEWFEDLETGDAKFTGFRWENRFRPVKKEVPLNPMIYVEYEDLDPKTRYKMEVSGWVRPPYKEEGGEPDRERILETRLVLSNDVGPVNLAFNWINETDLSNGETAFGYSLGAMWMIHGGHIEEHENHHETAAHHKMGHMAHHDKKSAKPKNDEEEEEHHGKGVGLGLEMYGALGDTRSFGLVLSRQEHYLGPTFVYHINSHWMIHAQLAIGLSKASDNLVRVNLGYEF